jgi:hypothetical protein
MTNSQVTQAKQDIAVLARTEKSVRVAFTMLVAGEPRATDLGVMAPADALVALEAAVSTADIFGAEMTSVSVYRVSDV